MKFILKKKSRPKEGDIKIKEYFAFAPVQIGNEIRFLERIKTKQRYVFEGCEIDGHYLYWKDIEFLN